MYYYLITENSIEEKIFETLKQRKDYTDELFRKDEVNNESVSGWNANIQEWLRIF